jgi:hypothetical protein
MMGEAKSWGNVACDLPREFKLPLGSAGQESNDKVLHRDQAHAKQDHLGVGHVRRVFDAFLAGAQTLLWALGARAPFIVPTGERFLPQLRSGRKIHVWV